MMFILNSYIISLLIAILFHTPIKYSQPIPQQIEYKYIQFREVPIDAIDNN